MLVENSVIVRIKGEPAKSGAGSENKKKGGKNTSDATTVKLDKTKTILLHAFEDNRRYKKTRNNKKDIYPDKTAFNFFRERVKQNNGDDRNSPQSIDVATVFGKNKMIGKLRM